MSANQTLICIWSLLTLVFVPGSAVLAQALPIATGPGTYVVAGGTLSDFNADYGSKVVKGASIYVDTNLFWRYGIETELRRIHYPSFGESEMTALAGPRWSFRSKGIIPYTKILVGGGRFIFPYGYGHGDYFVVAPGAGVDVCIGQKVRVRAIDVEYQEWPGFSFGAIHPYGVSAGISVQLAGILPGVGYHHLRHSKVSRGEAAVDTGLW